MLDLIETLGPGLLFVIVGACFMFGMLTRSITTIVTSTARERTRREIAAYIAGGSLSPEQGERLMRAEVGRRVACAC